MSLQSNHFKLEVIIYSETIKNSIPMSFFAIKSYFRKHFKILQIRFSTRQFLSHKKASNINVFIKFFYIYTFIALTTEIRFHGGGFFSFCGESCFHIENATNPNANLKTITAESSGN